MPLFQITDIRISSIMVAADDAPHATHLLLEALKRSIGYFPRMSHRTQPAGPEVADAKGLDLVAGKHAVGFVHYDGVWKIVSPPSDGDYDPPHP